MLARLLISTQDKKTEEKIKIRWNKVDKVLSVAHMRVSSIWM